VIVTDAQSANERFRALLDEARPPSGGVALADVAAEVGPVIPLLDELPVQERAAGDFESFQFRECFTVLTLLGRRLALLDLTPTAAVQIVELALSAVDPGGELSTGGFNQRARTAAVEGFVMGREEHVARIAEARASQPVRPLRVRDDTFALVMSGVHEPSALTEAVDALGRAMLDADASIGIIDLTQLGEPNRERARAIFAAEEVTRMLGAACIFSGVDPRWQAAAADARIHLDELSVVSTFAKALATAEALAQGARAGASPKWRALLDRLRR
jgi:hypothetical protein